MSALWDVTRAGWRALPAKGRRTITPSARRELFVHYLGGHPAALAAGRHTACEELLRAVQRDHRAKWNDLGYNGAVCPHGIALEGRGVDVVGAHCPDHNRAGIGIVFLLGGAEFPTPAQVARFRRLGAALEAHVGHALTLKGHRDGVATDCPGPVLYPMVRAGQLNPSSTPTPTPALEEDDMPTPDEIAAAVWAHPIAQPAAPGKTWPAGTSLWSANTYAYRAALAKLDPAAVAAAVVRALPATSGALTASQVTQAAETGLRNVLGSLDEEVAP